MVTDEEFAIYFNFYLAFGLGENNFISRKKLLKNAGIMGRSMPVNLIGY